MTSSSPHFPVLTHCQYWIGAIIPLFTNNNKTLLFGPQVLSCAKYQTPSVTTYSWSCDCSDPVLARSMLPPLCPLSLLLVLDSRFLCTSPSTLPPHTSCNSGNIFSLVTNIFLLRCIYLFSQPSPCSLSEAVSSLGKRDRHQ